MKILNPINNNMHNTFDFARGLAVFLVFFSHLDNYIILIVWPFSYQPLQHFIGQLGVHLFFLVSGYLIWASAKQTLKQPNGILRYAINRLTRIYPLYLVCIVSIVLFAEYFVGQKKPDISFEVIARHMFFLQSFDPNVSAKLNAPFWTLTHEFLFYLLVPVLYFFKPSSWLLLLSIIVSQFLYQHVDGLHGFFNIWCLFVIGILIQEYQKVLNKFFCFILLLVVTVLCIEFSKLKMLEFLFAALLFNTLLNFKFNCILFKPLRALGVISYSVYIWHHALIHLISPYIKNVNILIYPIKPWLPFGFTQEALFLIVFILTFSTISYYLIEKPSMTLLRKKLVNTI